jgi:hypothetical protein
MRLSLLTALVLGAAALLPQTPQDREEARPAVAVGEAAPLARLNDHTGKAVAFGGETAPADTAGAWTVLAFYPKALTGG